MTTETAEIVPTEDAAQVSLYRSADPRAQLEEARERATVLMEFVNEMGLAKNLGGSKPHVQVEGWQFIGSQVGIFPLLEWTKEIDNGYAARVQLIRASDGVVVGAGESQCRFTESNWSGKDHYAVQSMAETRATSKAFRNSPVVAIMVLAGFASTPAEEMDGVKPEPPKSTDDPHCPACLAVNGELVAVSGPHDKKPYWRCTNKGEKCAGSREHNGKTYSWSGWHESFDNSRGEWLESNPQHAGVQEKVVGERADYTMWIVDEIERTLVADRDKAKALVKTGLVYAIEENRFDPEQALGEPLLSNDLDDEQLRRIITNLDAGEAQIVVTAACELGGQE